VNVSQWYTRPLLRSIIDLKEQNYTYKVIVNEKVHEVNNLTIQASLFTVVRFTNYNLLTVIRPTQSLTDGSR